MPVPPASSPAPVTLLYGRDRHRQEEQANRIIAHARAQDPQVEIKRLYGTDAGAVASLFRELSETSLFAAGKVVVVLDAQGAVDGRSDGLKRFAAYLDNPAPGTWLVLRIDEEKRDVSEALRKYFEGEKKHKHAQVIECKPTPTSDRAAVKQWFTTAGVHIEDAAAQRLGELRAEDAGGLEWCLQHLRDHAQGNSVTLADVERALAGEGEGNLWGFIDAVGQRRVEALIQAERLLRQQEVLPLWGLLRSRLRDLCVVRELLDAGRSPGMIQQQLKRHELVMRTLLQQAKYFRAAELRRALVLLAELNAQLRGGTPRSKAALFTRCLARIIVRDSAA